MSGNKPLVWQNNKSFVILQSCTKLLGHFVQKLCSPLPKINVVKDSALGMNERHVYTNIALWGREGEDACLEHGY